MTQSTSAPLFPHTKMGYSVWSGSPVCLSENLDQKMKFTKRIVKMHKAWNKHLFPWYQNWQHFKMYLQWSRLTKILMGISVLKCGQGTGLDEEQEAKEEEDLLDDVWLMVVATVEQMDGLKSFGKYFLNKFWVKWPSLTAKCKYLRQKVYFFYIKIFKV